MRNPSFVLAWATLATLASAQESYWVGSAAGVARVNSGGVSLQTVPPTTARDVAVAPDGKVWYVAAGVTVLNPNGTLFRTITPSAGISPFAIAFDKAGHAWVSGGTSGVEEFDAAGNSLGTVPLPAAAGLGICVDASGNKWIAHRVGPPGSVSRIDAVTRAVTNHPLPGSLILPITPYADARGPLQPSHIWVVGDNRGGGDLVELDSTGAMLNRYVLDPSGRQQWLSGDVDSTGRTRNVWVGDWGNGNLHKVDAATGTPTTTAMGSGVRGVTFDGFGNLWVTISTGSLLRRLDPATVNIEVNASVGASTQLATRWQFATVVDQLGDLDGDGVANLIEVMNGSSPFDGCSTPAASLSIEGPTSIGSATGIRVLATGVVPTGIAFATAAAAPGVQLPGVGCALELSLASLAPVILTVSGTTTLPVTIPNDPGLIGGAIYLQGLNIAIPRFTNVACMLFY